MVQASEAYGQDFSLFTTELPFSGGKRGGEGGEGGGRVDQDAGRKRCTRPRLFRDRKHCTSYATTYGRFTSIKDWRAEFNGVACGCYVEGPGCPATVGIPDTPYSVPQKQLDET